MKDLLYALHELKPLLLVLLLPPTPLLVLLLLGASLLRRNPWPGRLLLAIGVLGLWFAFSEVGADSLQRLLLQRSQALDPQALAQIRAEPQRTAVLVLGGGALREAPEYGGPSLKPISLERLRYGVWLARHGDWPLGFSGGTSAELHDPRITEAGLAQQAAAQEWQHPLRWAEDRAPDTLANARLSLPMLQRDGVQRVLLVTHDVHMSRALRAFRRVAADLGMEIVPAPMGLRPSSAYGVLDWVPSSEAIRKTRYVVYEVLGLLGGR